MIQNSQHFERKEGKVIFRIHQITIGNEVFFLRLTENAAAKIEKRLGVTIFSESKKLFDRMFECLLSILWGTMLEVDPDFTFKEATELYDRYIDDGHCFEEWFQEIDALLKTGGYTISRSQNSEDKA